MDTDNVSRRDAVKLAAAGVAVAALAASNAMAAGREDQPTGMPSDPQVRVPQDPIPLKGRAITLGLKEGVKADAVHKALDEIFRLSGCTGCGFLGFDLILRGPWPEPWKQQLGRVEQLEGIRFAEVEQKMQR